MAYFLARAASEAASTFRRALPAASTAVRAASTQTQPSRALQSIGAIRPPQTIVPVRSFSASAPNFARPLSETQITAFSNIKAAVAVLKGDDCISESNRVSKFHRDLFSSEECSYVAPRIQAVIVLRNQLHQASDEYIKRILPEIKPLLPHDHQDVVDDLSLRLADNGRMALAVDLAIESPLGPDRTKTLKALLSRAADLPLIVGLGFTNRIVKQLEAENPGLLKGVLSFFEKKAVR